MEDKARVPVAIKPLEWELINGWWFGPTAEGQNYIVRASSATNFKGQWLWGLGVDKYELAPSLETAKAAAQSDYEARIRSALLPPPGETEGYPAPVDNAERAHACPSCGGSGHYGDAARRAIGGEIPSLFMGEWQDISTAPREGGFLAANTREVWAAWHYGSDNWHAKYGSRGATHWMPLPSAPSASIGETQP